MIFIKVLIKIFIIVVVIFCTIFSFSHIYAKYVFTNEFYVANVNIDRTKPKIELVYIDNSNTDDKDYANKDTNIVIRLKIVDKNLKDVFLDKKHVNVQIGEKILEDIDIKFNEIKDIENGKVYEIQLKNLQENGSLKLNILEGTAIDVGGLKSEMLEINTGIIVEL